MLKNPIATLNMKNGAKMTIELYPDKAPNTVNNFIWLAKKGFYNGLVFHRVISGFMIQGGCPNGNGRGNPGYSIVGEFASNGFDNPTKHLRGVISMARSASPNSAGSQFFIMHMDAPHLDGNYAAFGKVLEGIEVLDGIAGAETDAFDKPFDPQVIDKIDVETFGGQYSQPKNFIK